MDFNNLKVFSWDDGYGDNKCDNGSQLFLIPSFYTNFRKKQGNELESIENNTLDYITVEHNGMKYFVGKAAVKQDSNISWVGGDNKHRDKGFPILLNACLGLMTNESSTFVDTLVMGLPVNADTVERRELLNQLVKGTHHFKFSFDGINFIDKVITIDNLIIKKQPFGSLCDIILDDVGNISEKETAKGFNVIADIGARTFNIYTSDALETVSDLTTHTTNGMYTAYHMVGQYIEQELGLHIPDGKLATIIQNKTIKGYDLTPIINHSFDTLANEIKKVLDKLLINSWAFVDRIIFTGGGTEVLKPYLSKMYMDRNIIFLDRFSTARGLRKYGVRQTIKKQAENKNNPQRILIKVGQDERQC